MHDERDEVMKALVIGKKKSGAIFPYMTQTETFRNHSAIGSLMTDLSLEMIAQAEGLPTDRPVPGLGCQ